MFLLFLVVVVVVVVVFVAVVLLGFVEYEGISPGPPPPSPPPRPLFFPPLLGRLLFRAGQNPDDAQLGDVLDAQVAQVARDLSSQIFRRDQPEIVVVGRLQTVVAVAAVAQELEALRRPRATGHLLFVPALEHGQEVVGAPVPKLVGQKVGHSKSGEAALLHQPPEVGGGQRFVSEKGDGVEGAGRLLGQIVAEFFSAGTARQVPAVVEGYLLAGPLRQVLPPGLVILHAKSKAGAGGIPLSRVPALPAAPNGDETRFRALVDAPHELVNLQALLERRQPNRPGVGPSRFSSRQQALPGVSVLGRRRRAGESAGQRGARFFAVHVRAAGGDGVVKAAAVGRHGGESLAQPPAKSVHPSRERFLAGRARVLARVVHAAGVVTAVVPAGTVVIDVEKTGRPPPASPAAGDGTLESQQQIAALLGAPAEHLLSRSRVEGRRGSRGPRLESLRFRPGVDDQGQVPPTPCRQILHYKRLFRFGGVAGSPLLDQPRFRRRGLLARRGRPESVGEHGNSETGVDRRGLRGKKRILIVVVVVVVVVVAVGRRRRRRRRQQRRLSVLVVAVAAGRRKTPQAHSAPRVDVHLGRATRTQRRRRRQARSDVEGAGGHGNVGELCSRGAVPEKKKKGGERQSGSARWRATPVARVLLPRERDKKERGGAPPTPRGARGGPPLCLPGALAVCPPACLPA